MIDIRRLEYFLSVAENGSFSRAATVIGVAQPALGRQVQRLEDACGARLFHRHGRGVTLTAEGVALRERIQPLLRELGAALDGVAEGDRAVSGAVRIGLTPTVLSLIGLSLVQRLRSRAPGVQLNVLSGYSGYVHEWLADGRLDVAVLHDANRSRHIGVDFLAEAQLFLVSRADAPRPPGIDGRGLTAPPPHRTDADAAATLAQRRDGLPIETLAGLPLALPSTVHGLRRTVEAAAAKARISLDVRYEIDALELMKDVVKAGDANTVLALPAVVAEVQRGELRALPLGQPRLATHLMVATATHRPLTRATRAVIAELAETLRDAVARSPLDLSVSIGESR